jgi:hypothetical protein
MATSCKIQPYCPCFSVNRLTEKDYTCYRIKTEYILKTAGEDLIIVTGRNIFNAHDSRLAEEGEHGSQEYLYR